MDWVNYCRPGIFRDLNSIREKYPIAKISTLIILTVLGPFSCILGVFRVFAVFCRHCFSPIREKYTLAEMLVGHSRTIDAREINPFYSILKDNFCPKTSGKSYNFVAYGGLCDGASGRVGVDLVWLRSGSTGSG